MKGAFKHGNYLAENRVCGGRGWEALSEAGSSQAASGNIGKYGEMRRKYLQEHRKTTYSMMVLEETLKQHLMDVNEQAYQQIEESIDDLLKANPAPDKAANQLGWIQHMNMLKMQAEEIVLQELIYA